MKVKNSQILYLESFLQHHPAYFPRDSDGKFDHPRKPHPNPPWAYRKSMILQNCHFYHQVLFNVLHGQSKVPIHCQTSCFKVVVQPRNLEEVFWTYLLQRQLDLPSKCGSEGNRENSNKLWGAYWYNRTIEEGQARYKQIKALYTNAEEQKGIILGCPVKLNLLTAEEAKERGLPEEVPIILKRACTEFENHCGPSPEWTWDEEQLEKETLALDAFVSDQNFYVQNEYQLGTLFSKWIHDSYRWGEDSYLKFTNGNILFTPCVTYHDKPDWKPEFPEITSLSASHST
jgi:hypothetical protein